MASRFLSTSILALLVCAAFGCSTKEQVNEPEHNGPAITSTVAIPSTRRNDPNLSSALDHLLAEPEYATARWGVAVFSLNDGKLLYGHNHEQLFTPASNMKIYTTAVALDFLGADYRWRTSVYADNGPDANGTIKGDLVLYGRGAPDLVAENRKENQNSLEELAAALVNRGVKRIVGNIIGDESYFRGETTGEGWQWNDLQWYFGAEANALSINSNSADISVTPAQSLKEPPRVVMNDGSDEYFQVTNNTVTVERGKQYLIGVHRGVADNNVVVWGEVPLGAAGFGASLSVYRPSLWAAKLFLKILRAHGIIVEGNASYRDWRVPVGQRFNPDSHLEVAYVLSKSLGDIVRQTNKRSINLYAELILRTLGRERGSMLGSNEASQRERGDEEAGTGLVHLWLSRAGISSDHLAIHDGSGLSRLNLVTPESLARLLLAVSKTAVASTFMDSLPVAGTDGTLQGRLIDLAGRVTAKTGTIAYDHSLSGYLTTESGEKLVFSILCDDFVGKGSPSHLIDELVLAMANASRLASPPQTPRTPGRKP